MKEVEDAPLPDDGSLTVAEFGLLLGVSRVQAARRLAQLVQAGKATRQTKRMRRNGGGVIAVPSYALL